MSLPLPLGPALLLASMISSVSVAQSTPELRELLFGEADAIVAEARAARAQLLAPESFAKGLDHHRKADEKLSDGKKVEDIRKELDKTMRTMNGAIEAAKLAEITLALSIAARADAEAAEAPRAATELWRKGEKEFNSAARILEKGDLSDAKKKGKKAETLFREAELAAIKSTFLDETRALLARAESGKVDDVAPATLGRASELLHQSERELEQNRYDTDLARSLAQQSNYEAKHALYLAGVLRQVKKGSLTPEHLVLSWETELAEVAAAAGVTARFDAAADSVTNEVVEWIQAAARERRRLAGDVADRDRLITDLETQVADLEKALGGFNEEQMKLKQKMETQAEARRRYERVEWMFGLGEADILRQKNGLTIRLVGLSFRSGGSSIDSQYYGLLAKLSDAIALFPGAEVVIEGHTDSHGGDELNLGLSRARASAVREYLTLNSSIEWEKIEAIGHGEMRPIASNETSVGRARNRRIDVVVRTGR
ncbi:MAG: hypothetical protein CME06_16855 [Gemmatimonadetes bacterium]|nr:hypothetical protein [Gemmatimonadota bacterium]